MRAAERKQMYRDLRKDSTTYLLRDIPNATFRRFKARCKKDKTTMRREIIRLMEERL